MTGGIARKPGHPSFEEFLRPGIVKAFGNTLAAAKRGDALFAPQTDRDDPDLLLSRIVFTYLAFDAPDQLVSGDPGCSGSLSHLRSIRASIKQDSSVAQTPESVR